MLRLLALLLLAGGTCSAPAGGAPLHQAALHGIASDPQASQDSFFLLGAQQQRAWASLAHSTLSELLAQLEEPLEVTMSLDVRLVGFEGDGDGGVSLDETDWRPFLEALRLRSGAHDLSAQRLPGGCEVR